jgi:hypothetical protein
MIVAAAVSPLNGVRPASSSYSSTPAEKMSDRPSIACPSLTCSGDMYERLSSTSRCRASVEVVSLATPKSSTLTVPSGRTNSFAGLMSRCVTPCV